MSHSPGDGRELDALPGQKEINPTFVGLISFWNPATSYSSGRFPSRSLPPGNSHSRVPWPLLAIPDTPPRCVAHRARSAPVPLAARACSPSQVQCCTLAVYGPGTQSYFRGHKRKTPHVVGCFPFVESGSVLLSRAVTSQVPSALKGLTSVFGMGTGGSLSP